MLQMVVKTGGLGSLNEMSAHLSRVCSSVNTEPNVRSRGRQGPQLKSYT